jgi:hypothetical protein
VCPEPVWGRQLLTLFYGSRVSLVRQNGPTTTCYKRRAGGNPCRSVSSETTKHISVEFGIRDLAFTAVNIHIEVLGYDSLCAS